jgi:hypothetical protein
MTASDSGFAAHITPPVGPINVQVSGPDALKSETVRSALMSAILTQANALGAPSADFEFGLVVKW